MILFQISNHQSEDCGDPPQLPDDLDTGPYWRSYFENKYGEQWLFLYNEETKEAAIHSGDCGWKHKLGVKRVPAKVLYASSMGPLEGQFVLAGKTITSVILGQTAEPPPITFVIDEDGNGITCNAPEQMWIDACIEACGVEVPLLTDKEFEEHLDAMRSSKDEDEEEDD